MRPSPLVLAALVLAPFASCSDRARDRSDLPHEPVRERRVIEPPVGIVRALPPHAIRADGVGPYRLGERLSSLLQQLPSGPRIALFEIPKLLHCSLIRAEDDTILIGGEPSSSATFVAVVGSEVARTDSGIHVGSTKDELVHALGPLVTELDRAYDPRLAVPSGLPNARIVMHDDKIAAIVVTADASSQARVAPARDAGAEPSSCARPPGRGKAFGACLTGAGELVEIAGRDIALRAVESERLLAKFTAPAEIVFAAPLRASDDRDELVVLMRDDTASVRTWSIVAYRVSSGRITTTVEPTPLYVLSASNSRWIGAELADIDLYLEVSIRSYGIEVGGLLTTSATDAGPPRWRDVVVLSPVTIARRQGKAAPSDEIDAGVTSDGRTRLDAGGDLPAAGASGALGSQRPR